MTIKLITTRIRKTTAASLADVQRATTPLGRVVSEILVSVGDRLQKGNYFAWDPLAAVALADRSVVRSERLPIGVRLSGAEDGRTARDGRGANIEVALGADSKRFFAVFVTTLAHQ